MQDDASDGGLELLHHAAEAVACRRHEYGLPAEHFEQVARRWSSILGTTLRPEQVILCLLDLKIARLAHHPDHRDSLVDLIGYSMVLHELVHDASAATRSAEVAELAERKRTPGRAAAEAVLKSAEVRSING